MDQPASPVITPAIVHRIEHTVSLPEGLPRTDENEPSVALTQSQVNYLINHVPSGWIATFKRYWPAILFVMGVCGKIGGMLDRAVGQLPVDPPAIVAPADPLQKMIDDAVKKSLDAQPRRSADAQIDKRPSAKANSEIAAEPVEPKEPFEFKK